MSETVGTFWLESEHGVSLDVDKSLSGLIARHYKSSNSKALVFFVSNGVKKFIQYVN